MAEILRSANEANIEAIQRMIKGVSLSPEVITQLNETAKGFETARKSMTMIASPNFHGGFTDFEREVIPGLNVTIRAQRTYIQFLDEKIKVLEQKVQQLEQMLDDKKKKKPDARARALQR